MKTSRALEYAESHRSNFLAQLKDFVRFPTVSSQPKHAQDLKNLHSGNFGGAIHNPLQALCEMIAALHDNDGRVAIPGFYEQVRPLTATERASMRRSGPSDARILHAAGAEKGWGERGYSLYERSTLRPALTVNGILGGYQGLGVKAVIPARALAKLSFRIGLALPDDRIHAPNEKFHLPNFYQGIATSIWFLAAIGALRRPGVEMREEEAEWSLAYDY